MGGLRLKEMPLETWDEFAEGIEGTAGLHVVIQRGLLHSVAVQLEPNWEGGVWVSDSLREEAVHFDRWEFLGSIYSRALLVQTAMSGNLEDYPH